MEERTRKSGRRHGQDDFAPEAAPTFANKAVFALLWTIPIVAMIAFGTVDMWAVSLLVVLTLAMSLFWLSDAWISGELKISRSSMQIPLFGLVAVAIIQLLPLGSSGVSSDLLAMPAANALSLDAYATRFFLIRLIVCVVFFAAALAYFDSRKRIRNTAIMIVVFGAAMAFFGIIQRIGGAESIYGLRATPQAIPFGPFVNQHHFAAFMEMTLGITLGLLFGKATKSNKKLLLGIAAGLMGIAVVMTGSRGGFISVLGVVGFVGIFSLIKPKTGEAESIKRPIALVAGIGLFIVLTAATAIFLGGGDSLLRSTGLQGGTNDISSGRLHFWGVALKIFFADPIFGAGFDAFGTAFSQYDTWNGFYRVEQAHNDYLQMLADGGILAFACIVAFVFLVFKQGLAAIGSVKDKFLSSTAVGAMAGCSGILIHSFFDFPLRTQSNALFFLLLIVLATAAIRRPEPDVSKA